MRRLAKSILVGVLLIAAIAPAAAQDARVRGGLTEEVGVESDGEATEGFATTNGAVLRLQSLEGLLALGGVVILMIVAYGTGRRWGGRLPLLPGSQWAKILGRVYLDRGTALHFVQIGERVLLVGASANAVSLLAEFSSSAFSGQSVQGASGSSLAAFNPDSFLAELRSRSAKLAPNAGAARGEEDEIAALRGDIQRLQRYLREENRDQED